MESAVTVQTNGRVLALSLTKRSIFPVSCLTEENVPRRMARSVMMPPLDLLQPRGVGGRVIQPWALCQPDFYFGVLVGRLVVNGVLNAFQQFDHG